LEWFKSPASKLVSPGIQINSEEADKVTHEFIAFVFSACRLSTSKITFSDMKKGLSVLEHLLKHKLRLRKLKSNPGSCMQNGSRKAFKQCKTKLSDCEVTLQVL
jgi:hypothetical protein